MRYLPSSQWASTAGMEIPALAQQAQVSLFLAGKLQLWP